MSTVDVLNMDGTAAQSHRLSTNCWKPDLYKHPDRGANGTIYFSRLFLHSFWSFYGVLSALMQCFILPVCTVCMFDVKPVLL